MFVKSPWQNYQTAGALTENAAVRVVLAVKEIMRGSTLKIGGCHAGKRKSANRGFACSAWPFGKAEQYMAAAVSLWHSRDRSRSVDSFASVCCSR
jgi:hypothetical protein